MSAVLLQVHRRFDPVRSLEQASLSSSFDSSVAIYNMTIDDVASTHPEDVNEPILAESSSRWCMFPIKYNSIWEYYKKAEASFWTGVLPALAAQSIVRIARSPCCAVSSLTFRTAAAVQLSALHLRAINTATAASDVVRRNASLSRLCAYVWTHGVRCPF